MNAHRISNTVRGAVVASAIAAGSVFGVAAIGTAAAEAATKAPAPVSLSCSADQTTQAVTTALKNSTAVKNTLLSKDNSTLIALQLTQPSNTVAIKECRRDISAINATNSEVAHANDYGVLVAVSAGVMVFTGLVTLMERRTRKTRYTFI